MEGCAVQSIPVVPHNSIKKLPFVFDWLFSNPLPTNQELIVRVTLNKPCPRSHAHMPPATCIRHADAPSRRGLLYKQGLSPAPMKLRASAVGGYCLFTCLGRA